MEEGEPDLEAEFVGTQTSGCLIMGKQPILNPKEVVILLEKKGFTEVRREVHISNTATRTADARLSPSTPAVIFLPYC